MSSVRPGGGVPGTGAPCILVVDDNPDHRVLIEAVLRRQLPGTRLRVVATGEEAIAYLTAAPPFEDRPYPSVLLLDIELPGLSGLDVLDWLATRDDQQVPVVMLTAILSYSQREAALERGAAVYLEKPADFATLAEVLLPYLRPGMHEALGETEAG